MNTRTALMRRLVVLGIVNLGFLTGCGGQSVINQPPPPTAVIVSPVSAAVQPGTVQQFTSSVTPSEANQAVNWSVSGAGCTETDCGTIDATGKYTAPANMLSPPTVTVTATSDADSTKAATATVTIIIGLSLNPSSLAFGNQAIDTTSAPRTVTLTNTSSAPYLLAQVAFNGLQLGDFAQTNDCPSVIDAGASCTFSVTFTPAAKGARIGDLVINGGLADESLVALTGTGTASCPSAALHRDLTGQDVSFEPAVNYPVGSFPNSVAVGDFDGDCISDLAVANGFSDNVSVLLGNGDGTFQPAQNFAVGFAPNSVAVGDFDGDGVPDLAVANIVSDDVSVLLGNGDGSFQPARSFAAGAGPNSVAVGDFNGDGQLDLAVANLGDCNDSPCNDSTVSVLLGNGDGSFQAARNLAVGSYPISVAVGDFNRDGLLDLAVSNFYSDNVSVLLGNGNGTFQEAQNLAVGSSPTSVAVGDFNGDELPDLAVSNAGSDDVSVLLGNGDGTFQGARNFDVGGSPRSVVVGDFNGDGLPDLALTNFGDPFGENGSFSVLLGSGDGTFQAAQNFAVLGPRPYPLAVGDFNGDGMPDLALTTLDSNNVSALINNTSPQ